MATMDTNRTNTLARCLHALMLVLALQLAAHGGTRPAEVKAEPASRSWPVGLSPR